MGIEGPADHWTAASVDVRRLEYFLAVVDHGGVGRAAEAILVAQPSLSQAIKTLENELGAALFDRSGRRLVLTTAGSALVAPARQLLDDLAAARGSAQRAGRLEGGWLDLVALPTLAVDPLAGLAGRFRLRYPRVGLSVPAPQDAEDVIGLLRSGEYELGLTLLPCAAPDLEQRELAPQHFAVVLPPAGGRPSSKPGPLTATELAELDWVATPPNSSTRALLEQALAGIGRAPIVAVETDDREAIVPLVLSGAGATLLPRSMAEQAARRGARVREVDPPLSRRVGLLHRRSVLSAPARAFVELATDAAARQ